MHPSVLLLCSGGLDSVTLGHSAGDRLGAMLFVDYGQPVAEQERAAALSWAEALDVPLLERALGGPHLPGRSMAGVGESGPRVVPGRNAMLLAVAAAEAARLGLSEVWIGCTREDFADYPDCRMDFFRALSSAFQLGGVDVQIRAPYALLGAEEILRLVEAHGIDSSATWSCYDATDDDRPCGRCNSCQQPGRAR